MYKYIVHTYMYMYIYTCMQGSSQKYFKEGGPFITRICNFIILSKYIHFRALILCKDKYMCT